MSGYTPTNRVNGPKLKQRTYRTTCKICRFAIYEGERTVWLTSPMGVSHKRCAS